MECREPVFFYLTNHAEWGQQSNENEKHKIWLEQLNLEKLNTHGRIILNLTLDMKCAQGNSEVSALIVT